MIAISDELRIFIWIIVAMTTIISSIILIILEEDIKFIVKKFLPGIRPGRKPTKKPFLIWAIFYISVITTIFGTAIASASPTALPTIPKVTLPEEFKQPKITRIATNYEIAGYSKQSCATINSQNNTLIFIRDEAGNIGTIFSEDNNLKWSTPVFFDTLPPPGAPGVSVAIDSADTIHAVWSSQPDASNLYYRAYDSNKHKWIGKREIIASSTFARDITVDSANHPHIIWSGIDITYTWFDGNQWADPKNILKGAWHPDIQITSQDDLFVFANGGSFYPDPNVTVFSTNNINEYWKPLTKINQSPFWSGGIAGTIDQDDNIYVTWLGSKSDSGGSDSVYFSTIIDNNQWLNPMIIGELGTSGGSTGAESPGIFSDSNNTVYVIWRGLNSKNRPVLFVRAYIPPNSKLQNINSGWSEIIMLDDRDSSNISWPCIATVNRKYNSPGVTIVWNATVGTKNTINISQILYP